MCAPTVADVERKQTLLFVQGNPVDWFARDNVPWRGVRAANLELNKKAAEKFFAQCANERKQTLPFVQGKRVYERQRELGCKGQCPLPGVRGQSTRQGLGQSPSGVQGQSPCRGAGAESMPGYCSQESILFTALTSAFIEDVMISLSIPVPQ